MICSSPSDSKTELPPTHLQWISPGAAASAPVFSVPIGLLGEGPALATLREAPTRAGPAAPAESPTTTAA